MQEAEDLAANHGIFHLDVSSVQRKHIDLLIRMMKIRARFILKKYPGLLRQSIPQLDIDSDHIPTLDSAITPQFSSG